MIRAYLVYDWLSLALLDFDWLNRYQKDSEVIAVP